jgi:hypothetical protein
MSDTNTYSTTLQLEDLCICDLDAQRPLFAAGTPRLPTT